MNMIDNYKKSKAIFIKLFLEYFFFKFLDTSFLLGSIVVINAFVKLWSWNYSLQIVNMNLTLVLSLFKIASVKNSFRFFFTGQL